VTAPIATGTPRNTDALGTWLVAAVRSWCLAQARDRSYPSYARIRWDYGPDPAGIISGHTPGSGFILTREGSALLEAEGGINNPMWQVRTIGAQNDAPGAESLAFRADKQLLSVAFPQMIGNTLVHSIVWAGGGPSVLEVDTGRRWHWVCTYVIKSESGQLS
jgi:hypothetical protein